MKWRIGTLISFFGVLYIALIFQLYNLQFKKNSFYEAKAESQQVASGVLTPNRGFVYFSDKNGNRVPAILNKEFDLIYAVPKEVPNPQVAALNISKLLGLPVEEVQRKLAKSKDEYEELKFKATAEEVDAIKSLNSRGIYIKKQEGRYYPLGTLAAQVLGFVSPVDETEQKEKGFAEKGRYGIEKQFNDELAGSMGKIKGDQVVYPIDGKDIVLTIDSNIQAQAEDLIKAAVEKWSADNGTLMVEDPKTGKILAMANYPTFDPNNYASASMGVYLNNAVQSIYEPGSVMKPITMSAGIDAGKITPDTAYNDTGSVTLNHSTIRNWDKKAYGRMTMTGVIEHSLNVGTAFAVKTMGKDVLKDYFYDKYLFKDKTGINLPGERGGNVASMEEGQDIAFATAGYGQGIAITPLKMMTAIAAIANHGVMMKPLIRQDEQPQEIGRVVSEDTARKVTGMMVSAVHVNKLAEIPNYEIAGKTGTAFMPNFGHKGYSDNFVNSYEGYAPAYDPKFLVFVKLQRPKGAPLAGQSVLPAFRDMTQFLLNYYAIAPQQS